MPLAGRADPVKRVADGIERRFEDFLAAEVADTGKPVALARRLDVPRGAASFRIIRGAGMDSYRLGAPRRPASVSSAEPCPGRS
jgi:aminomuconate-semialdehyde/2-hydroxymuconate-6-semialdehyde dehydrogenase